MRALDEADKPAVAIRFGFARPAEETLSRPALPLEFHDACRFAFSALAARMQGSGVIAIVSPHRGDGRSSVASGLSWIIAQDTGSRVLLVDLDFERPALARLFSVSNTPGLADYLEERSPLRVLAGGPAQGIQLIPAGGRVSSVPALLNRVAGLGIGRAVAETRWVLLDLPPLLAHPETGQLVSLADAFVVVGRYRSTPTASLRRLTKLLPERPAGFFMTGDHSRVPTWLRRLL